eukprot:scaffold117995_cov32-Tisochrysis_lutea.AAC.1
MINNAISQPPPLANCGHNFCQRLGIPAMPGTNPGVRRDRGGRGTAPFPGCFSPLWCQCTYRPCALQRAFSSGLHDGWETPFGGRRLSRKQLRARKEWGGGGS